MKSEREKLYEKIEAIGGMEALDLLVKERKYFGKGCNVDEYQCPSGLSQAKKFEKSWDLEPAQKNYGGYESYEEQWDCASREEVIQQAKIDSNAEYFDRVRDEEAQNLAMISDAENRKLWNNATDQDYKQDAGKVRLSTVPPSLERAVAEIRAVGIAKDGDNERWREVSVERYFDAMLRHLNAMREHGLQAVDDTCEGVTYGDTGHISEVLGRVVESLEKGEMARPTPTPWHGLNRVLKGGLVNGEMAVLAARPGIGKTAFAGCLAVEIARLGKPVLFISREVKDVTLGARLLAREAKVDNRIFREGLGQGQGLMSKIYNAKADLDALPLRIVEKSVFPMTAQEIRRQARSMKGIGLVVVDYLQLVTPSSKTNSREREVAEMSRAFKELALDCDCPVLLLSQLNRKVEETGKSPQLSDLRESGAIEQDADIVIFLHTNKINRHSTKTPVQVHVAKGRSSGTGTANMIFDKVYSNFFEDESYYTAVVRECAEKEVYANDF